MQSDPTERPLTLSESPERSLGSSSGRRGDRTPPQQCPSCDSTTSRLSFYSCCLMPACRACYSGMHLLECAKRGPAYPPGGSDAQPPPDCSRCQAAIQSSCYSCQQCQAERLCAQCFEQLHRLPKFQGHSFCRQDANANLSSNQRKVLMCSNHSKIRNVVTESGQLVCHDCSNLYKMKKFRVINYSSEGLDILRRQIKDLAPLFSAAYENCRAKWQKIRAELRQQYQRAAEIIKNRYQQNNALVMQIQGSQLEAIRKGLENSKKAAKQSDIAGSSHAIFLRSRLSLLCASAHKDRLRIESFKQECFKLVSIEWEKFEPLIRNFGVIRAKPKQNQERESMSTRKPNPSVVKPDRNNLSLSRRSLSKSISKLETYAKNEAKEGSQSVHRSQALSKNQTLPIRNATPPQSKSLVNSSHKKSAILRQNSIMSAKLEDITPVMLNFDAKENNVSRINFSSNFTENSEEHTSGLFDSTNVSRVSKKKTDYFDLRDRMRKPSLVNNRFAKR